MIMKKTDLSLVDGTSALSREEQVEAELAKDRWDARNIPGLRYARHTCTYSITFTDIPDGFRPIVKNYAKCLLAAGRASRTLTRSVLCLRDFFTFFSRRHATIETLHVLSEQDIDAFILHLKTEVHAQDMKRGNEYMWRHIDALEDFLLYLERIKSEVGPEETTSRIIWSHHYPGLDHAKPPAVKYIPQTVLRQLDDHMQHLHPNLHSHHDLVTSKWLAHFRCLVSETR